uniref:hypothetical protein n=1 Tax=Rheinheimera sp. TaxID=1869214 RepID=UPI004048436F
MPFVFAALFAFIGSLISRIGQWFLTAFLTGALKTIAIATAMIISVTFVIYTFVVSANQYLLDLIQGLNPVAQASVMGILAMLPKNLPYLITIILTYYTMSIGLHLSIEIYKLKAKWAEKALSHFKA